VARLQESRKGRPREKEGGYRGGHTFIWNFDFSRREHSFCLVRSSALSMITLEGFITGLDCC